MSQTSSIKCLHIGFACLTSIEVGPNWWRIELLADLERTLTRNSLSIIKLSKLKS